MTVYDVLVCMVSGGGCGGGYVSVFVYMIYREAANIRGLLVCVTGGGGCWVCLCT